jgi:hypothetical protein
MIAYKIVDPNSECKGFKYEIGKTYCTKEPVQICRNGFHACANPVDVFRYKEFYHGCHIYEVELSGDLDTYKDKTAAEYIKIVEEIEFKDFLGMIYEHPSGSEANTVIDKVTNFYLSPFCGATSLAGESIIVARNFAHINLNSTFNVVIVDSYNWIYSNATYSDIYVTGSGNRVFINGSNNYVRVYGIQSQVYINSEDTVVDVEGRFNTIYVNSPRNSVILHDEQNIVVGDCNQYLNKYVYAKLTKK